MYMYVKLHVWKSYMITTNIKALKYMYACHVHMIHMHTYIHTIHTYIHTCRSVMLL